MSISARFAMVGQACLLASLLPAGRLVASAAPSIEFTSVPPYGSTADLAGRVREAAPAIHRVAVFIYVPGAGWWSKPFCNPVLTVIQADGNWTTDITTGGADAYATKIAALLVTTNFSEPCVTGLSSLPTNVLAQALASVTVERFNPAVRQISFSGYDWWVKDSPGQVGPGPNYFSSSSNNVWLDAQGRLHLRITNRSNQWQCAELVTRRSFGCGHYRFELESTVNDLNSGAVLGLFTWSDDPAYAHREIDVECSRWRNAGDSNNAQFVVQPWDVSGHLTRYAVAAGLTQSTHMFTWETNRVRFQSQRGWYSPTPAATNVIREWTFSDAPAVPQPGDENVRLNLWLVNGDAPAGNSEVEFVIRSFHFLPLGRPQPAILLNPRLLQSGSLAVTIQGNLDWRYEVQVSPDLSVWQPLVTALATNSQFDVVIPNTVGPDLRFLRALTLP